MHVKQLKNICMMKTMMISMMMFLTALASEAQVMTSATVTNLYE